MRRVREWPRLIAAVALLAAVLVLIGVVVASAASSGGGGNTTTTAVATTTPRPEAPKSDQGVLKSQAAQITRLRATNATQKAQIATLEQQLKRERALRRIRIHAKVKHHKQHHANRR
jgi:negative regulator of sigma E activity